MNIHTIKRIGYELAEKFANLIASQPSPFISFIGILIWIGATVNIALSFIYLLKQGQFGAFVSMTMLASFFYLAFTSFASNFEVMIRRTRRR